MRVQLATNLAIGSCMLLITLFTVCGLVTVNHQKGNPQPIKKVAIKLYLLVARSFNKLHFHFHSSAASSDIPYAQPYKYALLGILHSQLHNGLGCQVDAMTAR